MKYIWQLTKKSFANFCITFGTIHYKGKQDWASCPVFLLMEVATSFCTLCTRWPYLKVSESFNHLTLVETPVSSIVVASSATRGGARTQTWKRFWGARVPRRMWCMRKKKKENLNTSWCIVSLSQGLSADEACSFFRKGTLQPFRYYCTFVISRKACSCLQRSVPSIHVIG